MSTEREASTTGRRSRRAKTKVIDYAKEQEFSDEDLFEDVGKLQTVMNKSIVHGDVFKT